MEQTEDIATRPDEILTLTEVADLLKLDKRTVRRHIATRGLPAHNLGGGSKSPYRFIRSEVMDWVRISCSTPAADQHAA